MIIAETKRLLISKVSVTDAAFFLNLLNTPSYLKFIGDKKVRTLSDAENHIKENHVKSYKTYGFGFYKVNLKAEAHKTIGTVGLIKRETLEDVDIGFAYLPQYEGLGYGYESSKTIVKLAKTEFKLKKLMAITDPQNKKSINLLEKLEFKFKEKITPFKNEEVLLLFIKTL